MKLFVNMVLFVCVFPFYFLGYIWAGIASMFLIGMEDFKADDHQPDKPAAESEGG